MRLLLDTHAIAWWLLGDAHLSAAARDAITEADEPVLVSAVSAMEISTKHHLGRWPGAGAIAGRLHETIQRYGFVELPISAAHGDLAGALPIAHKDPFDRLLIAQAQIEQAVLVSNETLFDRFAVRRLW